MTRSPGNNLPSAEVINVVLVVASREEVSLSRNEDGCCDCDCDCDCSSVVVDGVVLAWVELGAAVVACCADDDDFCGERSGSYETPVDEGKAAVVVVAEFVVVDPPSTTVAGDALGVVPVVGIDPPPPPPIPPLPPLFA